MSEATNDGRIDVDQLISEIDAKHGKSWDIYRSALGEWCFKIDSQGVVASSSSISKCLKEGLKYTVLQSYPSCPGIVLESSFSVHRTSPSKWEIRHNGQFWTGGISTKRQATKHIENFVTRSNQRLDEWERDVLPLIAGKIEGVDYRFEG